MKLKKVKSLEALEKINTILSKKSNILDIGSGAKEIHANMFRNYGHSVDTVDFFKNSTYKGDFNSITINKLYDVVWASHCLEHQLNVNNFLKKTHATLKIGGYLVITVPPLKHQIVGGHVSLWNAGLLIYNLVLAGYNCSNAMIKEYGYNISVIVQKDNTAIPLDKLEYDTNDLITLNEYFPVGLTYEKNCVFNGDIKSLNW